MDAIRQISILCLLCVLLVQAVEKRNRCPPPYNKHWCFAGGKRMFNTELSDRDVASDGDRPGLKSPQPEAMGNSNDDQDGYLSQSELSSYIPSDPQSKKDYRKGEEDREGKIKRCLDGYPEFWCHYMYRKRSNIQLPGKETPSDRDLPVLDSSQQKGIDKDNEKDEDEDDEDDTPLPSDVPPIPSASPTNGDTKRDEEYDVRDFYVLKRILTRLLEKEATDTNN